MKSLIILLFIAFVSAINIQRRLIENNLCVGGQIENGVCKCPSKTVLIGKECKKCINGRIILNRCICPKGRHLDGNECKYKVCSPGYIRIFNDQCIKKCPDNQIRVGNKCQNCSSGYYKNEYYNECLKSYNIEPDNGRADDIVGYGDKPVIYLYPKEAMDISVQLNIKNSKFTTIYPKFNGKNTWNIRAKPNGDILIKDKTYPYLFWEAKIYAPQETNEGLLFQRIMLKNSLKKN